MKIVDRCRPGLFGALWVFVAFLVAVIGFSFSALYIIL